jgi:RNA recognition motif-containing protein
LPKDLEENGLKRIFVDAVKPLTQKNINTTMQQVKIVRDPARDNRSRGYGFVEFKEHAAALEALRVLNNNKTVLKNNQGYASMNMPVSYNRLSDFIPQLDGGVRY